MSKSPLAIVKEKFGEKSKLVSALSELTKDDLWVDRVNKNKSLESVPNAKLLRLHRIFSEVKEKFGTRAKLIDAVCEIEKRSLDAGFRKRLEAHPVPRLYDAYRVAATKARRSAAAKAKAATPASPAKVKVAAKAVQPAVKPTAAKTKAQA